MLMLILFNFVLSSKLLFVVFCVSASDFLLRISLDSVSPMIQFFHFLLVGNYLICYSIHAVTCFHIN